LTDLLIRFANLLIGSQMNIHKPAHS